MISQLCILKSLGFSWDCGHPRRGSQGCLPLTSSPRMEQLKTVSGLTLIMQHVHARVHTHTHTHTSAHRPAQPWGSAIHMDNTSCRLTKRFLTCCVPFLPLDHFGHQHTGQYNHSPECCLTIKQLRLCGRGREPHTISLRLRGKQGK